MPGRIFITTTLPYINSAPHIGHALEFIQADVYKRAISNSPVDVHLNVGVDEHGTKVYEKAIELELDAQEYCDQQSAKWKEFCEKFLISYDTFYRTTDGEHHRRVSEFWLACVGRDDLYKSTYSGKYCKGCESYKLDKDLVDGKCPDHGVAPVDVTEENWFFRITKYKDEVLELVQNTQFLIPDHKQQELINIVEGSADLSVSRPRTAVPWGVQVPNDDTQTIYVWFEALLNYLFAAGPESWDNPATLKVQLCGPDNIRFQGGIFQSFLRSAGHRFTDILFVHGTVLGPDGRKMSKTIGNVVDPLDQLEKYGLDCVRYYAIACLHPTGNTVWSEEDLVNRCNADLADNYGNLLARVLHLIDTSAKDHVPGDYHSLPVYATILGRKYTALQLYAKFEFNAACDEAREILRWGNQYVNDKKPWTKYAGYEDDLYLLLDALKVATDILRPVTPHAAARADAALLEKKKVILFQKLSL